MSKNTPTRKQRRRWNKEIHEAQKKRAIRKSFFQIARQRDWLFLFLITGWIAAGILGSLLIWG